VGLWPHSSFAGHPRGLPLFHKSFALEGIFVSLSILPTVTLMPMAHLRERVERGLLLKMLIPEVTRVFSPLKILPHELLPQVVKHHWILLEEIA
jgi:hypothetical protein